MKKDFDCIQFKHQAQARIYERIKGLPLEKEIEYFRNAADEGPPGDWRKAIKARAGPSPGTERASWCLAGCPTLRPAKGG